jgi:hypothetical protein
MMAKIAAAATITHLAHVAGHQTRAKTTTAAASKNRQKQSFMSFPPTILNGTDFIISTAPWQGQNVNLGKIKRVAAAVVGSDPLRRATFFADMR